MQINVYTAVRQILKEQVITIKMKKKMFFDGQCSWKIILMDSLVENL